MIYDLDGGRLPFSVEAEQAVLGSIIINPSCLPDVATMIKTEYFYLPQHKEIYTTICSMFELNQAIDFVSLLEKLKKSGVYDEAGGKAYLTTLVQNVHPPLMFIHMLPLFVSVIMQELLCSQHRG